MTMSSLVQVTYWYNEVKRDAPDALIYLVGTKSDESESKSAKISDAVKLAQDWGAEFRTVSARDSTNVNELFQHMIDKLMQ